MYSFFHNYAFIIVYRYSVKTGKSLYPFKRNTRGTEIKLNNKLVDIIQAIKKIPF